MTPPPGRHGAPRPCAGAGFADLVSPTVADLVVAYGGHTYRLLVDLADHLGVSLAYVDRATVEAHLERDLSDAEWARANAAFGAMSFDDWIGDHGTVRTDWIDEVLDRAGITAGGAPRPDVDLRCDRSHGDRCGVGRICRPPVPPGSGGSAEGGAP